MVSELEPTQQSLDGDTQPEALEQLVQATQTAALRAGYRGIADMDRVIAAIRAELSIVSAAQNPATIKSSRKRRPQR